MSKLRSVLVLGAGLALGACAASSDYMRPGKPVGSAPGDMAQLVFVRPSSFAKGLTVVVLDAKGHFIGDSAPGSHFVVQVPSGEHTFIAWGEGTHSLKANVAAGKTYYVEVAPVMGVWSARFHLKALKPGSEKWVKVKEWIADTEPFDPMITEGQALVDRRREDAQDAITKGVARFAEYDAEELAERTLAPSDGI